MSFNFGERIKVEEWGRGIQLSADGFPKAKAGGVTFDWDSITALTEDTYLPDQLDQNGDPVPGAIAIPAGSKVLRYGTPIQDDGTGVFVLGLTGGSVAKGDVYLVNQTVVLPEGVDGVRAGSIWAIDGGRIFKDRILHSTNANLGVQADGGGNVASGVTMTLAQIEAACPNFTYAKD